MKTPQPYMTVGLTGGIGSGKTAVAERLSHHGVAVVDTDQVAHALTAPGGAALPAIERAFGRNAIASNGAMDRAFIRQRVFSDQTALSTLESILHPMIRSECETLLGAVTSPYVVLVVPLLVEKGGWLSRVDRVLVVDCPEALQITRVMARSGLSQAQVQAIMDQQASRAQRLEKATDVVSNHLDLNHLHTQTDALHHRYMSLISADYLHRIKT